MPDYGDPHFSEYLARELQARGFTDTHLEKILHGGAPSGATLKSYIEYCIACPIPRFPENGAHIMVARRMETVLCMFKARNVVSAPGQVFEQLITEVLRQYPIRLVRE